MIYAKRKLFHAGQPFGHDWVGHATGEVGFAWRLSFAPADRLIHTALHRLEAQACAFNPHELDVGDEFGATGMAWLSVPLMG